MGSGKIRVGLIGRGGAGKVFHEPLIRACPRLELAGPAAGRGGARELLDDASVELIVIATPNETHRELALAALDAGKHVVVDKPLAVSSREAQELIARAAARGRTLSVFQNRRWDGDFLTVKRLLDEGVLGDVESFESRFDRYRPAPKPGWREEVKAGSGILCDLGSHLIDQALVLFGAPESVTAEIERQRPDARVDDYFRVVLNYGECRVVLGASMLAREPGPRFSVRGDAGSYVKHGLDPQEEALKSGRRPGGGDWGREAPERFGTLTGQDGARRFETVPGNYPKFYEEMAACLLDGAPVPVAADDARRALVVLEAARLSASEKRTVAMPASA
jgi:scyllo-inositol 2-dehydrogenase (NADP+)